ncbi:MAG: hypothetical protein JSS78_06485 [Bacteroidetes bacterium]|nr:hypothetical protein [Bacteroidota bacterium]
MTEKEARTANGQFGKMAGLVLNSTAVLRLNIYAKLNICASISATSPSCKNVMWHFKTTQQPLN